MGVGGRPFEVMVGVGDMWLRNISLVAVAFSRRDGRLECDPVRLSRFSGFVDEDKSF